MSSLDCIDREESIRLSVAKALQANGIRVRADGGVNPENVILAVDGDKVCFRLKSRRHRAAAEKSRYRRRMFSSNTAFVAGERTPGSVKGAKRKAVRHPKQLPAET